MGSAVSWFCCCWRPRGAQMSSPFPGRCVVCAECVEDQYLFGRDSKCNYVLDDPDNKGSKKFQIYSKRHFKIYRVSHLPF